MQPRFHIWVNRGTKRQTVGVTKVLLFPSAREWPTLQKVWEHFGMFLGRVVKA